MIDDKHVLSAAHCFSGIDDDIANYLVVLGEYNRDKNEGLLMYYFIRLASWIYLTSHCFRQTVSSNNLRAGILLVLY